MAENYDVGHYCKASSPDALKPAQEYFGKCVPVILEGLSGINDKPQDWLRAVDGITGADEEPMKKRLFFVHVDEPVIAPSAVAAHEADLDAIVAEGKRRRLELPDITASESDLTPTTAGSAHVEAMSTPGDSDDDDDVPDNAAFASSFDASQLPAGASGPPDGKPLDALYNLIIGQTVLPSWRRLEALGPFSVEAPQSPEEFACRFRERFPNSRGVVPSHLTQGVVSLLGNGPEIESCGRFIHELAGKIPAALARLQDGVDAVAVLQEDSPSSGHCSWHGSSPLATLRSTTWSDVTSGTLPNWGFGCFWAIQLRRRAPWSAHLPSKLAWTSSSWPCLRPFPPLWPLWTSTG